MKNIKLAPGESKRLGTSGAISFICRNCSASFVINSDLQDNIRIEAGDSLDVENLSEIVLLNPHNKNITVICQLVNRRVKLSPKIDIPEFPKSMAITEVFGTVECEIKKPVSISEILSPVAVAEIQKPVAVAEIQKPVAIAEIQKPVAIAEIQKPVAIAEIQKPVAVDEIKKPVVVDEIKKPVAVDEIKKPVVVDEIKKPVVVDEIKKPVAIAEIQKPVAIVGSSLKTKTPDHVIVQPQDMGKIISANPDRVEVVIYNISESYTECYLGDDGVMIGNSGIPISGSISGLAAMGFKSSSDLYVLNKSEQPAKFAIMELLK